jgi:hypothetical protein
MRSISLAVLSLCAILFGCSPTREPVYNYIAVSGSGELIAFYSGMGESPLTVYESAEGTRRTVGPSGFYGKLQFTVDQKFIICSFSTDELDWRIAKVSVDDGEINILTDGPDFGPIVVSNSKVLFWRSYGNSGDLFGWNRSDFALCELDLKSLNVRQLTNGIFFHMSSVGHYDDKAFFTENGKLYTINLQTRELSWKPLRNQSFRLLAVTPAGVVIGNVDGSNSAQVLPAQLHGDSVRVLTNLSQVRDAAVSRGGRTLFFGCIRPWAIYEFDVETNNLRKLPIRP